jgi:hypothetical protein
MNASDILEDVLAALRGELADGFSAVSAFAQRQGRMLAVQAELIGRERIDGSLRDDDELFGFFLDGLQRDTLNMARSIAMLTILTIERAWNAIANALWGGIRQLLTAAGIPGGLLPATPPLADNFI